MTCRTTPFFSRALKNALIVCGIFAFLIAPFVISHSARAIDQVEELQKQIDDLEKLKQQSEAATKPLEQELKGLANRITQARTGISKAKDQAIALAKDIDTREADMALQYEVLSLRVARQYKKERSSSPLLMILSSDDATKLTKDLAYQASVQEQDNRLIQEMATDISQLEKDKTKLEDDQVRLAALEKQLASQTAFFQKEIDKAKVYQQDLSGKIAALSAQQQSIINARSGSTITAVGDVPAADDFNSSIGFKAQAPGDSFAVFSFGGHTHRNGMSQYGAKARAEAGQSVEEILKAYYPNATLKKDYPVMETISVNGTGTIPFEDQYLHGIYEMPGGWNVNALKAQAIAARTYAIRHTSNGQRSICTTEACQVFKNSRKGGAWETAVKETRGWVLVDDAGNPVLTQYASTHGGYARTSGWDTTDKSNDGEWTSRAWERKANSPWFYKSWYRSGYNSSTPSCGRAHPWLSQQEMSDIINAWIVRKNAGEADPSRIQPITINTCNVGGGGGNPYSMDELRGLAEKSGGAVTRITAVSSSHNNSGQTSQVTFQTNRGTVTIPGDEFKTTFNLRAPGYISIPQSSFAFFNIEYKP